MCVAGRRRHAKKLAGGLIVVPHVCIRPAAAGELLTYTLVGAIVPMSCTYYGTTIPEEKERPVAIYIWIRQKENSITLDLFLHGGFRR